MLKHFFGPGWSALVATHPGIKAAVRHRIPDLDGGDIHVDTSDPAWLAAFPAPVQPPGPARAEHPGRKFWVAIHAITDGTPEQLAALEKTLPQNRLEQFTALKLAIPPVFGPGFPTWASEIHTLHDRKLGRKAKAN